MTGWQVIGMVVFLAFLTLLGTQEADLRHKRWQEEADAKRTKEIQLSFQKAFGVMCAITKGDVKEIYVCGDRECKLSTTVAVPSDAQFNVPECIGNPYKDLFGGSK